MCCDASSIAMLESVQEEGALKSSDLQTHFATVILMAKKLGARILHLDKPKYHIQSSYIPTAIV